MVWTQKVLDCRRKYAAIVNDAFSSDRLFLQAMNQAFEVRPSRIWCTHAPSPLSCVLAQFLHLVLFFTTQAIEHVL